VSWLPGACYLLLVLLVAGFLMQVDGFEVSGLEVSSLKVSGLEVSGWKV